MAKVLISLPDDLLPRIDRDAVRNVRNDVMHFDPEGVGPRDLETLRAFARFLQHFRRYDADRYAARRGPDRATGA